METTNSTIVKIMNVLFWIAFIGLCIKAGSILISFCVSMFVNPIAANDLYLGTDLSEVFEYNQLHYSFVVSLLFSLTALKAYIAYLVVQLFMQFKLAKPFHNKVTDLLFNISHYALGAGIIALIAFGYCKDLIKKGLSIPIDWSGEEILFFAGVIYLLAEVFKKGYELQTESDLTV